MFSLSPSRTVVTSFNPKTSTFSNNINNNNNNNCIVDDYNNYDEGDWVLCVATRPGTSIACALSNGQIQLYDQHSMHLLHTYYEQNSLVTEMTFETFREHVLATSNNDGSLMLYDIRQQQQQQQHPALQMKGMMRPEEEALTLSIGFDGNIAAVGSSRGRIHFFDLRSNQGILGSYAQAHTDEVTRVRFQGSGSGGTQSTTSILVSGSEDGLACIFDTSQPTEESAITNILSVQAPIRELGFFGPTSDAIYCLTGSESMQLYHKDESNCRKDFGIQFRDEYLNQQLLMVHQHRQSPTLILQSTMSPMEYLVDCHWDATRQELLLLAGSAKGDAALFQIGDDGVTPRHYLHGGHRGVIRAWHTNNNNNDDLLLSSSLSSFLTVGEDARMCEWSLSSMMDLASVSNNNNNNNHESMSEIIMPNTTSRKRSGSTIHQGNGGGKLRRPRSRWKTNSPY
jgi:WD repeat-containing protein 89